MSLRRCKSVCLKTMNDPLEKIRQIKRMHESSWLGIEGVVAVGIGITTSGEPGIVISTKVSPSQLQQVIPTNIEGIAIEVRQSGEIKAF